jgi:enoyl-CoA hydratase
MSEEKKEIGSCILTRKDNYAIIAFNRPEKLNALSPDLFLSLQKAFFEVENDDSVRALIFTGVGDNFSAGGDVEEDIKPLKDKSAIEFKKYFDPLCEMYEKIYNVEKPTIAAINGFALGAGMELALMCDIRIAADTMQMGEFFVRMGLVPEAGMCVLPKLVGMGKAKLMCYTGELVDAQEALRIGLVEQVVPQSELMPTAEKLASRLGKGPASIKIMKRAINEFSTVPLELTMNSSILYQFAASRTSDHAEAVKAFLEKRKPEYTGK